jgi:hypothetical protein
MSQLTLSQFLNKYGTDTKTNFDLLHHAKELNIKPFRVVMINELKKLKKILSKKGYVASKPVYIICNYQTTEQKGSHWTALYKNLEKVYFFDSYGVQPDLEILRFLEEGVYSSFKIQPDNTKMCGSLCLYLLYKLSKGFNFYDIVLEMATAPFLE